MLADMTGLTTDILTILMILHIRFRSTD